VASCDIGWEEMCPLSVWGYVPCFFTLYEGEYPSGEVIYVPHIFVF